MRNPALKKLERANAYLAKEAFANYAKVLATLIEVNNLPGGEVLYRAVTSGDYTPLVEFAGELSSTEYSTAASHFAAHQLALLIRKYPFPKGSVSFDPEAAALEKFFASEVSCRETNERFIQFRTSWNPDEGILHNMRSWISRTLGDFTIAEVWPACQYGPGASVGVNGNATNNARKLLAPKWTVTTAAHDYARAALKTDDHIMELLNSEGGGHYPKVLDPEIFNEVFGSKVEIVEHNNITFVPKTVEVLRTIAVEPLLNGYLQKGLDLVMRKRLLRVGVDLRDQGRNQQLAYSGSLHHDSSDPYVTIDLSAASDSVAIEACRDLLPPDWFAFMDALRSSHFVVSGAATTPQRYEKFVTMGNGFCFPLETLIFASVCEAAYGEGHLKPDYSVYGDDIIVRSSVAQEVLRILKVLGFSANTRKTFLKGPFRESCGADWFEGEDVRPITLDYALDTVQNVFKLYNLSRLKERTRAFFDPIHEFLVDLVPVEVRYMRPVKGNVDTAFEVPFDVFMSSSFALYKKSPDPDIRVPFLACWSWVELVTTAVSDTDISRVAGYSLALIRGAMTGVQSSAPFTERRNTRTKVRRIAYCGHSSDLSFLRTFFWESEVRWTAAT